MTVHHPPITDDDVAERDSEILATPGSGPQAPPDGPPDGPPPETPPSEVVAGDPKG